MDTHDRWRDILINRPPNAVFVGDSHVSRMKLWLDWVHLNEQRFKLETKALGMSLLVYTGGSRWDTLYDRVQGINVPSHQTHGNILQQVLDNKEITPEFIFWISGINDLDWYNDKYHEALHKSTTWLPSDYPNCGPSARYKKKNLDWMQHIMVVDTSLHDTKKDVIDKLHDVVKSNVDTTVLKVNLKIKN